MRPLLVALLAVAIFGALAAYERFVATLQNSMQLEHVPFPAMGKFSVELMLSFDAAKDEFTLSNDPALVVRLSGQDLIRREQASAGEPLQADDVPGIVEGRNAFFVRAVPDEQQIKRPCAVQIRIL